jgi:chromosome segregation ATPase
MLFRRVYSVVFLAVLIGAFPFVSLANETRTGESMPTAGELEEQIREARSRVERIDSQMAALEDEEKGLMTQAREAQREQFELRQHLLDTDEELRGMVEQVEAMQRDLHAQQEVLAQRMAEHTNYVAFTTRQTAVIGRSREIRRETMQLANDRVRVQLELQALEKQWAGVAEDAAPEPEGEGTTLSAEDPDQI